MKCPQCNYKQIFDFIICPKCQYDFNSSSHTDNEESQNYPDDETAANQTQEDIITDPEKLKKWIIIKSVILFLVLSAISTTLFYPRNAKMILVDFAGGRMLPETYSINILFPIFLEFDADKMIILNKPTKEELEEDIKTYLSANKVWFPNIRPVYLYPESLSFTFWLLICLLPSIFISLIYILSVSNVTPLIRRLKRFIRSAYSLPFI